MSRKNVLSNFLKEGLLATPGIRWLYRTGLTVWDRVTGRVKERLIQKVHVASADHVKDPVVVGVDTTEEPRWLTFQLPITNESEDQISVIGVDLRFGLNRGGAEIGHVIWNSETGVDDPRYISCHDIDPHEEESLRVSVSPPEYIFRAEKGFSVRVSGTVEFDTSFGAIRVPVDSTGRVEDETVTHSFIGAIEDFDRRWSRKIES